MNQVIHVSHVICLSELPDFPPFSGAENHLLVLMAAQRAAGCSVELIILLRNDGPAIEEKVYELEQSGISVVKILYRPTVDVRAIQHLRHLLTSRRHHIIHTHLDYGDVTGKIAAWLAGCPCVVSSVHNEEIQHLKLKWLVTIHLLNLITRRYIAISEAVRQHMIHREHLPENKITVVPYGIVPPRTIRDKMALRASYNIPSDKFVVGFVGRLTEQKNIPLLLNAIGTLRTELPDLHCVLIGMGELRGQIESQIEQQQLTNVQMLGYQQDAADIMPSFDVLCLPSLWEGLGLVLIEAMLRRVPIIGSQAGAIPEVLGQGQYGMLFPSNNLDGLASCIRTIYHDETMRNILAQRAYDHAREHYTVERMVSHTTAVYQNLL